MGSKTIEKFSNGKTKREIEQTKEERTITEYDEEGNRTKLTFILSNIVEVREYVANGKLKKETIFDLNGNLRGTTDYYSDGTWKKHIYVDVNKNITKSKIREKDREWSKQYADPFDTFAMIFGSTEKHSEILIHEKLFVTTYWTQIGPRYVQPDCKIFYDVKQNIRKTIEYGYEKLFGSSFPEKNRETITTYNDRKIAFKKKYHYEYNPNESSPDTFNPRFDRAGFTLIAFVKNGDILKKIEIQFPTGFIIKRGKIIEYDKNDNQISMKELHPQFFTKFKHSHEESLWLPYTYDSFES